MRQEIVLDAIQPGLGELDSIWDYIGYDENQKQEKLHNVADLLQSQLLNFIEVENKFRVELESDIEARKRRAAQICQSLRLPPFFPPRGLPSLQLLQHLDEHIAQFEQEIAQRRRRLADTLESVQKLCDKMELSLLEQVGDERLTSADPSDEFIPTEQDLDKLSTILSTLNQRYESMLHRFSELAEDIRRIAQDIEHQPDSDFLADILEGRESSLKFSDATLSLMEAERLKLVKHKAMLVGTCDELRQHVVQMWTRLDIPAEEQQEFLQHHGGYQPSTLEALQEESEKCQELKWSQISVYLKNLRSEAQQLKESCFLPDVDAGCSDDSEESVANLERQIDELREAYDQNKDLYAAVNQYQTTWQNYLEVEQKMKDPAILSNRGGILLKTDKERKQLLKELPKVEAKVSELLQRLGGSDFRIQGRSFSEHVQYLWQQFHHNKEAAKFNRKASSRPVEDTKTSHSRDSSANLTNSPRKSLSASSKR